jgi:ubiquinone/menaquinone biosynthesis C-methylase UbiE
MQKRTPKQSTSWEPVKPWYHASVGDEGHYYHRQIIIPGVLRLLDLEKHSSPKVLDLACGQGVLARHLKNADYTGIDVSPSLIKEAKKNDPSSNHQYIVADITKALPIQKETFSHGAIILALQNVEHADQALKNAFLALEKGGKLAIVLNHPCFRVPRQSSWQVDAEKKIQYRRIDRYYSEMKIPIQAHPSKGLKSPETYSFHHSLASYSKWLFEAGFKISLIEEWCSDKLSTGAAAKMENRSREEIPLFMTILASKDAN